MKGGRLSALFHSYLCGRIAAEWLIIMRSIGLLILALFYAVYIGKMILQSKKGIQTDQMAKGKENTKVFYIELIMKIATYSVVVVEILCLFFVSPQLPRIFMITGAILGFAGDILFAVSVITMKDSWRAGIAENDKTEMITGGIYSVSRNPAFLAFDCVYAGLLLMFFHWVLLVFSAFAMTMLHLQILQEEQFLLKAFGSEYRSYTNKVRRYLGRK